MNKIFEMEVPIRFPICPGLTILGQVPNDPYRPIIDNLLLSFQSINKLSRATSQEARFQVGIRGLFTLSK